MASACHDAAPASQGHVAKMAMAHHGGDLQRDHPAPATPTHDFCLGCIPPISWDTVRIGRRAPMPSLPRVVRQVAGLTLPAIPPALPPPRRT